MLDSTIEKRDCNYKCNCKDNNTAEEVCLAWNYLK